MWHVSQRFLSHVIWSELLFPVSGPHYAKTFKRLTNGSSLITVCPCNGWQCRTLYELTILAPWNCTSFSSNGSPWLWQRKQKWVVRGSAASVHSEVVWAKPSLSFALSYFRQKENVSGWSKTEYCNSNFSPLNLLCMQYDTVCQFSSLSYVSFFQ